MEVLKSFAPRVAVLGHVALESFAQLAAVLEALRCLEVSVGETGQRGGLGGTGWTEARCAGAHWCAGPLDEGVPLRCSLSESEAALLACAPAATAAPMVLP